MEVRPGLLGLTGVVWLATIRANMVKPSRAEPSRAKPLYQHALAIRDKSLGSDHPHVATSLNNLAELYRGQGKHVSRTALGGGRSGAREQSCWLYKAAQSVECVGESSGESRDRSARCAREV